MLRQGVERFFLGDEAASSAPVAMRSQIPVIIERPSRHRTIRNESEAYGGNVLYLDGHVEFVVYPGKWPMTEKTIELLGQLDRLETVN